MKKRIEDYGTPQIALEIFSVFAGNKQLTKQNTEIEALKSIENSLGTYGKNIFAVRVDMPSGEISWQNGMFNVLGRTDISRYDEFQACFHPDYLTVYNFWSNCLFEAIAANNFDFNGLLFHIRVPFLNQVTNQYYWYNQHSIALIADTQGSVLSFLSIYTYDSEYSDGNPIIMLPHISENNTISDLDKVLKNIGGKKILEHWFTEMQRNILNCYIEGIKPINYFQTMSQNTINEHNVNIIKRAKNIFQFPFSSAEAVAIFLRGSNLWQIPLGKG
jgi:hypothetical protein